MRKIEQKMLDAIQRQKSWKEGNTQVIACSVITTVFLHGHEIVVINNRTGEEWANKDTFRTWPTVTTCSRLRALGFDARIKNHSPMLDGEEV